MKILHAIPSLEIGGAEKIVARLCGRLAHQGHDVTILLFQPLTATSFVVDKSVKVVVIPSSVDVKKNPAALWRIYRFIKREQYDVVHTHLTINNAFVRLMAAMLRVPVVVAHEHGGFLTRNALATYLFRKLQPFTAYNIYISQHDLEHFTKHDRLQPNAAQNIVLHNPLMVQPVPFKEKGSGGIRVIGMVGRLVACKGHEWALAAMIPFAKKTGCKIVLVGDGSAAIKSRLEGMAKAAGIDFTITGFAANVEQYYEQFDVMIQPSLSEGFGLTIIEAMAYSVPVIASAVGGILGIVNKGWNGLLVAPEDAGALQAALEKLHTDATLRSTLAHNAYGHVARNYSFDPFVLKIEGLYQTALKAAYEKRG